MSTVLGVDVSLTSTGVALYHTGSGTCDTHLITTVGRRRDTIQQRHDRIWGAYDQFRALTPAANPPILAVVEGPSFGSQGGSSWDRAGLWWFITRRLLTLGVPIAMPAPATRAKWATGNGRADKAAVASAITRRHNVDLRSSDEADAAALALMGAHWLGLVEAPGYATAALNGCTSWPDRDTLSPPSAGATLPNAPKPPRVNSTGRRGQQHNQVVTFP